MSENLSYQRESCVNGIPLTQSELIEEEDT